MLDIKRILYATDFSETAQRALCYALALAVGFDAQLDVLHAIQQKKRYFTNDHDPLKAQENIEARLQEAVQAQLEALHPGASERMEIHYEVQQGASVASVIGAYAERNDIDLVVMGTHGRSGVRHLLLGSVAEVVVRTAPCAVLTVRDYEEESEGPDVAISTHAIKGSPADKIIDFAQANNAGLIVMAHRGLTGMQRLMLRSVTECVLREAHCPVLMTKLSGKVPLRPEAATASTVTNRLLADQVRETAHG